MRRRLEERAPRGSRGAAGVVGSVHFGGGMAGVCEIGPPGVRVGIGVLGTVLFGFGVWPGTWDRSTMYRVCSSGIRIFAFWQLVKWSVVISQVERM